MHKLSSSKHAAEGLLSVLFQQKFLVYSCCRLECRMLQQYLELAHTWYIQHSLLQLLLFAHYLAFDAASGEAQLEESPTNNRSYMQVIGGPFRKPNDGADVLEGMSAIDEVLTIDPPATMEPEASCKAET